MTRRVTPTVLALCVALLPAASAGAAETYRIRMTPVPIEAATRAEVTGSGAGSATLDERRLSVAGTFSGLGGPATIARLHLGRAKGVRGPAIAELRVPAATAGELSGVVDLDAAALEALRAGRLYVQIHSERAPDGNLWGWLSP